MLQSCDLTTGNSAAPTPCCQLSPASSGSILNIAKNGIDITQSNSSNGPYYTNDLARYQNQMTHEIGMI
jgi:hypothetical protein